MPLYKQYLTALVPGLFLFILFLFPLIPVSVHSQSYILEARIGDTTVVGAQTEVRIPVYLKNLTDSVGLFEINIFKHQMGLLSFHDTIISEGCLTENWEYLDSRFLDIDSNIIKVTGIADQSFVPGEQPAIYFPQYGEAPLFYLLADLVPEIDSTDGRTILSFSLAQVTHFLVYDQNLILIGTEVVEVIDTNYFNCDVWDDSEEPPVCLSWSQVSFPPADSTQIDTMSRVQIDTALTNVTPGNIDVSSFICGDFAGSNSLIDLADITAMIAFVYLGGIPPVGFWSVNVNGDPSGLIDLADITRMIDNVYISKEPLNCYGQ